jgi:hypothetical protein
MFHEIPGSAVCWHVALHGHAWWCQMQQHAATQAFMFEVFLLYMILQYNKGTFWTGKSKFVPRHAGVRFCPRSDDWVKSLKGQTKDEEEGPPKTCYQKHHTILKNRMAVLRNRRPPRMHPGCADPLLKERVSPRTLADSESRRRRTR